jgi:hypothetical protein
MAASAQTPARVEDMRALHGGSAADLIGARVRSSDGTDIGEIEDLILSSDARVVTAIVSVGGVLDVADKLVAVPYGDLRVWSDDETLAIPLTAAEIEAAPPHRADPPAVGEARPVVDPERAAPPDEATRREAEQEAQRVFAGNDPRVADGIAENEKAFEDEEAQPEDEETQPR